MSSKAQPSQPVITMLTEVVIHRKFPHRPIRLRRCAHMSTPLGHGAVMYAFKLQESPGVEYIFHSKDVRMLTLTPALVDA
jgi:hypothetical protein